MQVINHFHGPSAEEPSEMVGERYRFPLRQNVANLITQSGQMAIEFFPHSYLLDPLRPIFIFFFNQFSNSFLTVSDDRRSLASVKSSQPPVYQGGPADI